MECSYYALMQRWYEKYHNYTPIRYNQANQNVNEMTVKLHVKKGMSL